MKTFHDFITGIQKEVSVPAETEQRFQETLRLLGQETSSHQVQQTLHDGMQRHKKQSGFRYGKVAGAAAVFVVASVLFFAANPAMASKLPLIGNIFEQVGNKSFYPGDYDNGKVLKEQADSHSVLTAEDKNISITASEVYSDGFSVFVGLKMDSDKIDFSNMYTFEETGGNVVTLATSYGINAPASVFDYDINLTGENRGKHTYIGMAKFNKGSYSLEDGELQMEIKSICFDDDEITGNWKLSIPYETAREDGKEIVLHQKSSTGMEVEKIFVSKYQLVLQCKVPYTMPYADKTDAEITEYFGGKIAQKDKKEIRESKQYKFFEAAVFDQDGNPLSFEEVGNDHSNQDLHLNYFSLRGKDVSKIHVYVTQKEENTFELIKAKTPKKAAEKSEFDFVAELK